MEEKSVQERAHLTIRNSILILDMKVYVFKIFLFFISFQKKPTPKVSDPKHIS